MNEKALRILEFHKIVHMLSEFASSAPGKALCQQLHPIIDLEQINLEQAETRDALSRLFKRDAISFNGNQNITISVKSLEICSVLSAKELLSIASLLDCVNTVKSYGRNEKTDSPPDCLTEYFDALEPLTQISKEIHRCILSEEEIADDASSHLKHIRKSIQLINNNIHNQLMGMVNTYRTFLQDAVITMRNNRYCIPVKAEYKGQVPGMIHDQSSTGSTLFIEPMAIVNLNNQLKELFLQEQDEIQCILADLSTQCSEHTEALLENQRLLTKLDFIFAKGKLALEQNASLPLFNQSGRIHIREGRHPLLNKKTVVPITLSLGIDFHLLIVTGPNTGGKTVSLKTVGLFTLMGQSGLHIPALDRCELSVFEEVFADIGDEQSIEQSLSTFSSHMTNIVSIMKNATNRSLCLFDELGAGTDPTEGAALAIAILRSLHEKNIVTMATTHYSELKLFALSTDGVENACCEFDVNSLRPTYKLLIGIPGKSNAFAISSKLGLTDDIIQKAKEQISEENESFEDVLTELEYSRKTMEKERFEIEAYKKEITSLKEQLQQKQEKMERTRERILREANEEAREVLQEAKDIADETIRNFNKTGTFLSVKDMEQAREKVRNKISDKNKLLSSTTKEVTHKPIQPNQLKLGDHVKVISMGLKGTVNSKPDDKGNLFVQCGIIRTKVNIKDLIIIKEDTKQISNPYLKKQTSGKISHSKTSTISMEINLLGKTVDEALSQLDKYLDDAYLSHLPSVRIVHGKGTGALRNAVHQHLKKTKYVSSFRLGEFGEGDAGVTIATFK